MPGDHETIRAFDRGDVPGAQKLANLAVARDPKDATALQARAFISERINTVESLDVCLFFPVVSLMFRCFGRRLVTTLVGW